MTDQPEVAGGGELLSIGGLAKASGVAVATLRMWETRFGFPDSLHRTPAGHRRYGPAQVEQILDVVDRRSGGMRLEAAIAAVNAVRVRASSSVYAVLVREHPAQPRQRLRKATLVALSRAIEDELSASATCGHLFGAFQTAASFEAALGRWRELARTAHHAVAMADFPQLSDPAPDAIERVALSPDAPLLREWVVVNDSPGLPVALSAWELPDQPHLDDGDRLFESVWTVDPHAVRAAARTCANVAASTGSAPAQHLLRSHLAEPPPPRPDLLTVTRLVHRMIAYVEQARI